MIIYRGSSRWQLHTLPPRSKNALNIAEVAASLANEQHCPRAAPSHEPCRPVLLPCLLYNLEMVDGEKSLFVCTVSHTHSSLTSELLQLIVVLTHKQVLCLWLEPLVQQWKHTGWLFGLFYFLVTQPVRFAFSGSSPLLFYQHPEELRDRKALKCLLMFWKNCRSTPFIAIKRLIYSVHPSVQDHLWWDPTRYTSQL